MKNTANYIHGLLSDALEGFLFYLGGILYIALAGWIAYGIFKLLT